MSRETSLKAHPRLSAVVLGGGGHDVLAQTVGVASKALVPFEGRPLVAYVLEALGGCPEIGRVVYVGEADPAITSYTDTGYTDIGYAVQTVAPGQTFIESLKAGLEAALELEPGAPILVTTADLPWLRSEAVADFLRGASGADLVYPVIRKETAEAQFPLQRRTFVKLQDGRFTGGNMMLLSPPMVPVLLPFAQRAYSGRKNPLALARLFGFDFIFRLLVGRLGLRAIEARAEHVLGLTVRALETSHASIGADVDKPEHLKKM